MPQQWATIRVKGVLQELLSKREYSIYQSSSIVGNNDYELDCKGYVCYRVGGPSLDAMVTIIVGTI
jgi:hypothetical protein